MDTIANMLTSIRNAQMALKDEVLIPHSDLKFKIAQILEKKEFVEKVQKFGRKRKKTIRITLKYDEDMNPGVREIRKISKSGQRIYTTSHDLKPVRQGYGIGIVSTSKGVMTAEEAKKKGVGGEYICQVW